MGHGEDAKGVNIGASEDGGLAGNHPHDPRRGAPSSDAPSAFEIQAPARQIKEDSGQLYESRSALFIKLGVLFREKWLRELKGPQLAVFLCLALHIDEGNLSFPSIDTICAETGYSNRSVIDTIEKLEKKKLVEVLRRDGKVNRYILGPLVAFGKGAVDMGGVNLVHGTGRGTSEPDDNGPVNLATSQVHTKKNHKKNQRNQNEEDSAAAKRKFLKSKGVGEPALSNLSDSEIGLYYLESHFCYGEDRDDSAALILHRIRAGDKIPEERMQKDYRRGVPADYWDE